MRICALRASPVCPTWHNRFSLAMQIPAASFISEGKGSKSLPSLQAVSKELAEASPCPPILAPQHALLPACSQHRFHEICPKENDFNPFQLTISLVNSPKTQKFGPSNPEALTRAGIAAGLIAFSYALLRISPWYLYALAWRDCEVYPIPTPCRFQPQEIANKRKTKPPSSPRSS